MTTRPAQLHVMLAPEELDSLKALADALGMNISTTIRTLIAAVDSTFLAEAGVLVLDKRSFNQYIRNIRALGHLYNQAVHALNTLAKITREEGVEPPELVEELELVNWQLNAVHQETEALRTQAGELTGRPTVFE